MCICRWWSECDAELVHHNFGVCSAVCVCVCECRSDWEWQIHNLSVTERERESQRGDTVRCCLVWSFQLSIVNLFTNGSIFRCVDLTSWAWERKEAGTGGTEKKREKCMQFSIALTHQFFGGILSSERDSNVKIHRWIMPKITNSKKTAANYSWPYRLSSSRFVCSKCYNNKHCIFAYSSH